MKIVRDSAFRMGVGSSFHQPGTVNENVHFREDVKTEDALDELFSASGHRTSLITRNHESAYQIITKPTDG